MAIGGIYIHFPYCRHHCFYCDFNVAVVRNIPQRAYTDAVLAELKHRASWLAEPVRSLYFGGGTPSLWETELLAEVIQHVRQSPGLQPGAEVTVEVNPDEVTTERLESWLEAGVTRCSVGLQALSDDLLRDIDRRHEASDIFLAVNGIKKAGFKSFTVDLMFGLPEQTLGSWQGHLRELIGLQIPHLSLYGLTVEPGTGLASRVQRGKVQLPEDELQSAMLFETRDVLTKSGYVHYEVSSYAKPGHMAVHNAGYWEGRPYLGLGAGAHGFVSPKRWENIRPPQRYIEGALAGHPTDWEETLDDQTLRFERVMTGLRRLDVGVDLGPDFQYFFEPIEKHRKTGWLQVDGTRICVTEEGLRWMNALLVDFVP